MFVVYVILLSFILKHFFCYEACHIFLYTAFIFSMLQFVHLTAHSMRACSPAANKQFYVAASPGILHIWTTVSKKLMTERVNETEKRTDGVTE